MKRIIERNRIEWQGNSFKITLRGRLIKERTKDKRSSSFLFQAISMEVQRGNCASVLGTVESPKLLQELFNLLDTKPDSHSA